MDVEEEGLAEFEEHASEVGFDFPDWATKSYKM